MKTTAVVLMWVIYGITIVLGIRAAVLADFEYQNSISSFWELSDRASTIEQKSQYLDRFVAALEGANLATYNATLLPTPAENTQQNMQALRSLQVRLHEIKSMDVRSFEYQQAISQITAQEQGEAQHLLDQLEGSWYLANHYFLWDWHGLLLILGYIVAGIGCLIFTAIATDF